MVRFARSQIISSGMLTNGGGPDANSLAFSAAFLRIAAT